MDTISEPGEPIAARPRWREVVLVCSRCVRRDDSGAFASLRKRLRKALAERGLKKRVRVVKSGCLGLCPKKGLVLARGSELAGPVPRLRVHRRGDDAQVLIEWVVRGADG